MNKLLEYAPHQIGTEQKTSLRVAKALEQMSSANQPDVVVPRYGPRLRIRVLSLEGVLEHYRSRLVSIQTKQLFLR
jgi:hypothetical protein